MIKVPAAWAARDAADLIQRRGVAEAGEEKKKKENRNLLRSCRHTGKRAALQIDPGAL